MQRRSTMRNSSRARLVNGVISVCIVVLFLVHGVLGGASALFGFSGSFSWVVWIGVAAIVAHVATSVVTSRQQLGDPERPPSSRKKRHLALKWATGGLLAVVAAVHVGSSLMLGPENVLASTSGMVLAAVLACVLALHICVGAKSLVTDLGLSRTLIAPFRVVVCLVALVVVIFLGFSIALAMG